ncbi:hypothetical protein BKA69DRAFT_443289 [Paraphysoderma sedebokerense]|nr:hypothetical protein BKA69DRAFT_443289 [Paraphysoderma sedebokerense]
MGVKDYIQKCVKEGRENVDLSDGGLGKLPKEFGTLQNTITSLTLCGNKFSRLPDEILGFQRLKNLNLFNNKMKELPAKINEMNIEILVASVNKISQLPNGFGSCPKLHYLDLTCNNIKELRPNFGYLTTLRTLHLADNKLTKLPEEICNLVNLEVLVIRDNQITELPKNMGNLVNLRVLLAHGNKIKVLPKSIASTALDLPGSTANFLRNPFHPTLIDRYHKGGIVELWRYIKTDEYDAILKDPEGTAKKPGGKKQKLVKKNKVEDEKENS